MCASKPADINIISGLNLSIFNKIFSSKIFIKSFPSVPASIGALKILENKILNNIDKFKPEIILISAGFDAHKRDPLAHINLESKDYYDLTKKIIEIANIHCQGRVISFLEGGYDLLALSESIKEHLLGLQEN